jgi:lipid-A-disaccharide synthase
MGGTGNKSIVIVAGETSGDQHGAKLVQAMHAVDRKLSFFGVGGPAMRAAGVRLEIDAAKLAVVGITEVFAKLPAVWSALRTLKGLLKSLRPALLVLIDFPEFNLRVAAVAKKLGIPVLYYISPQIWAWRPGRVKRIAACVDHMAVILPFEAEFYRGHGVKATFVGHPLLDEPASFEACDQRQTAVNAPVVGLLPGSRSVEIKRHLPIMLKAAGLLQKRRPNTRYLLSKAAGLSDDLFDRALSGSGLPRMLTLESGRVEQLLKACDVAVAVSGTVTLQAALCGVPMVVIYRVSSLSYRVGRALIRVPFIGLVNLVAGRQLATELVQQEVTAPKIAAEVDAMLADPQALARNRRQLTDLRHHLGASGASVRVADIALSMLK